jgi:hypothetical protein
MYRQFLPLLSLLLFGLLPLNTGAQTRPLSFIAIGDAGAEGEVLQGNAQHMLDIANEENRNGKPISLLFFLGDNFYPNGLNHPEEEKRSELIRTIIGPHQQLLSMLGPGNVHAFPGNHDYYCATLNMIPYGACDQGNQYEKELHEWTYHLHYPALIRRPLAAGSADSADFIIFDSALLLTQEVNRWAPALDSMERLMRQSATAHGVKWRIILAHHSPYSVGEHGGYRLWLDGEERVGYIGNCFKDKQDPFKYVEQIVSHQDNCTPRYQAYSDSLMAIITRSGAKVQLLMAGHDHSLQLLNYPKRNPDNCPSVFVVTGAGAKRARVKSPRPPYEFTHPVTAEKGKSLGGFTVCTFEKETLQLVFIDSQTGKPIDMGGNATTFIIDRQGKLTTR